MATNIPYTLIRSGRKTIAIEITHQGEVIVRCPRRMTKLAVNRFVASREDWITAHRAKIAAIPKQQPLTNQERDALILQAKADLPRRVAHYAPIVGADYGRITIRSQRKRWGSCSGKGNLNFNFLLMLAPEEVRDYVVVHELCHRLEMNHSPAFWAQVERILPDYRGSKKWLKDNGPALITRLPEQ